MSLLLLNLVLWPFLALVALPLILHLFARSKPPVYPFGSIEFIRRIARSTLRIKRPRDWMLLALRTLLTAAVIAVFLRPLFFADRRLADPLRQKHVVLIVDATASMAWPDGAQTRFAAACAEASEILAGLSARDSANVIWLKTVPEAVFPEMSLNRSYLQNALRRGSVTVEAGAIEAAVRLAASLLEQQSGRREICLISDFQKTAWANARAAMPPGIRLVNVRIGAGEAANQTLTALRTDPSRPLTGEEVTVYVDVHNYSPQPVRKTVFLSIAESRLSRDLMVPAWHKATAAFRHRFPDPGLFPVRAQISEDAFPADDRRVLMLEIRERLNVGLFPRNPAMAEAWRRALDAVGWIRVETLTDQSLPGAAGDAILLAGWNGEGVAGLRQALQTGTALICAPARDLPVTTMATLLNATPVTNTNAFRWESCTPARTLRIAREKDELFRLFTGDGFGDFSRIAFQGRITVPADGLPPGETLLTYDDGAPALMRFPGQGLLYLWTMPLATNLDNWTQRADFLPFLAELLLVSRRAGGESKQVARVFPGESVTLRREQDLPVAELTLRAEDGRSIPLRDQHGPGGVLLMADRPLAPGIYVWAHADKPLAWTSVEFPALESDLRAFTLEELETADGGLAVRHGYAFRQIHDGISLWPHLLALALVAALIEGVVALWAEQT